MRRLDRFDKACALVAEHEDGGSDREFAILNAVAELTAEGASLWFDAAGTSYDSETLTAHLEAVYPLWLVLAGRRPELLTPADPHRAPW